MNKVEGIGDVINALEAIGANIKGKELQQIMRNQGQKVINDARSLVPVNTGDLRDSIGFITGKDEKNQDKVLIGLRKQFYNHYLGVMYEYGTEPRIQDKTGRYTGVIEPRPFMRPALDKNKQSIVTGVQQGITKLVLSLAKKYKLQ